MNTKDNIHLLVGRFNPLTRYHLRLIESMPHPRAIAVTGSIGRKDPLDIATKLTLMGNTIKDVSSNEPFELFHAKHVIDALKQLGTFPTPRPVVLHCGTDRVEDYQRLNTYTHETGVEIVSVVEHVRLEAVHSATYLRLLATTSQEPEFIETCGYTQLSDRQLAYDMIRSYYASVQG